MTTSSLTLADLTSNRIGLADGGDLQDDPRDYEVSYRWATKDGWAAIVTGPSGESDVAIDDATGTTLRRDRGLGSIVHSGNSVYAVLTASGPAVYPSLDDLHAAIEADAVEVHEGDRDYYDSREWVAC